MMTVSSRVVSEPAHMIGMVRSRRDDAGEEGPFYVASSLPSGSLRALPSIIPEEPGKPFYLGVL
jgi:hypothetical protein